MWRIVRSIVAVNTDMLHVMDSSDLKRSFGTRVRARREQLGLSQERLALQIHMDRTAIAKIECGQRSVTLLTMTKLAHGLQTTMSELVEGLDL